jgi:enoyl-CoA hydratase/carnithine racemase
MSSLVELAVDSSIAVIRLNRPEVRNAISDAMRAELMGALEHAGSDASVRAVVLTGNGKSFCSGGDIAGMRERLEAPVGEVAVNGWRRQRHTHRAIAALHGLDKPTIAAVNGAAAGLGCDMALACDFIVAAEDAAFSMSFVNRGLVSDGGGLYFLPRRIGLSRAKDMIFTGRSVGAKEALAIGLADRVSPSASLLDDARTWARELSRGSPTAIALMKPILDRSLESTEEQVLAMSREAQAICYTTAEHQEAVAAFLDKTGR